jgi:hypothetical protein
MIKTAKRIANVEHNLALHHGIVLRLAISMLAQRELQRPAGAVIAADPDATAADAEQQFAGEHMPDEVTRARTIMTAHAQALAAGHGVVLLEGRLIENLHVAEARRVVALAEAIAETEALYQQQTV